MRVRSVSVLLLLVSAGLAVLAGSAAAKDTSVQLVDNAFEPADVTVEVGDTITWIWAGENNHSVRSEAGGFASHQNCSPQQPANCGPPGSTFKHTFEQVGAFTVRCEVHTLVGMISTVTVVEPAAEPSPSPSPTAPEPSPTPEPTTPPPPPPPPPTDEPDPEPSDVPPPPQQPDPGPVEDNVPPPQVDDDPTTDLEFEPFVDEPDIPTASDAPDVVVAAPDNGPSGLARGLGLVLGTGVLGTWVVLFGRLVLFADPWDATA